jgi:hypothetical protein
MKVVTKDEPTIEILPPQTQNPLVRLPTDGARASALDAFVGMAEHVTGEDVLVEKDTMVAPGKGIVRESWRLGPRTWALLTALVLAASAFALEAGFGIVSKIATAIIHAVKVLAPLVRAHYGL